MAYHGLFGDIFFLLIVYKTVVPFRTDGILDGWNMIWDKAASLHKYKGT